MKKLDIISLKVFLWGAPFVGAVALMASYFGPDNLRQNYNWLNDFSGLIFGIWFFAAFYFAIRILASTEVRERVFSRFAGLTERDEREEKVSFHSLRTTYLSNMAILIFFLIFAVLNVSVYRVPEGQAVKGKRGTIAMGMNLTFWNTTSDKENVDEKTYFLNFAGLPINEAGVLLLLIGWNLGSYRFLVRRKLGRD